MQLCEQSPSRGLVLPGRCLEAPQPCSVLQARHDFSIGTRVTPQVSIFLGFRPSEDQLQDPKEDNLAPLPKLGEVNEDEETTEAAAEASRPRLRGMDGFGVLAVGRAFKRNVHRLSAAALQMVIVPEGEDAAWEKPDPAAPEEIVSSELFMKGWGFYWPVVATVTKYPGKTIKYDLCYIDGDGTHTIPSYEIKAVILESSFLEFVVGTHVQEAPSLPKLEDVPCRGGVGRPPACPGSWGVARRPRQIFAAGLARAGADRRPPA